MKRFKKVVVFATILCALLSSMLGCNNNKIHNSTDQNTSVTSEQDTIETQITEENESTPNDYSQISNLPDIYQQVLDNKKSFTLRGGEVFIDEYKSPYLQKQLSTCDCVEYAVLDMDGNGDVELLIKGWSEDILVLHIENDVVYGYDFTFRGMYNVAEDGSFCWNTNAGNTYGVSKLIFKNKECDIVEIYRVENDNTYYVNNKEVNKEEFDLFITNRKNVNQITWYDIATYPKEIEETTPPLIDTLPAVYKQMLQNKHNFALGGHGIKEPTNIFIGQYKHPNSDKYLYEYDTVEYAMIGEYDYKLLIKDGDGNILMIDNLGALVSTDIGTYSYEIRTNGTVWYSDNEDFMINGKELYSNIWLPGLGSRIYKVTFENGQEKYYIYDNEHNQCEVTKDELDSYINDIVIKEVEFKNPIQWHKVSIEKYTVNEDAQKYSQKYANVEIEYEKILDAYFEFARSHRYGRYDIDSLKEKYSDISDECLYALDATVIDNYFNAFYISYATKDLNGDGVSELFLIGNNFNIYAIMTIINGKPIVIDSISNPHYDGPIYIDANGTIYTGGGGKGECWWKNVLTLNEDGKLCGYSYGHYDMSGFGDDDVYNYYCEYDSEHPYNSDSTALYKRISDDELEKLEAKLKETVIQMNLDGSENTNDVTRDAGLTVYQVITYCAAK